MPSEPWATSDKLIAALITLAVALIGGGIIVSLVDDDGDGRPETITITLGGADDVPAGVPAGPERLELDEGAVDELENVEENKADDHAGLDDERPPELPAGALEALPDYLEENAERNDLPDLSPLAAPMQDGCVTRLVGNQSSRAGVRPRQIWAHYTVSRNRPGWDDVNAIVAYFNNRASSASSHYVIDAEGNCAYIVPETAKAWTQAAANPYAISIEFIAYGDEPELLAAGGRAKAGKVIAAISRRWGIPLVRGAVNTATCVPTRAGVVQHKDGGACAGSHHDVTPFDVDDLIALARSSSRPSGLALLWAVERRAAQCLIRERATWPAAPKGSAARRRSIDAAKACKRALERRRDRIRRNVRADSRRPGVTRREAWRDHRRGPRHRVIVKVLERKALAA